MTAEDPDRYDVGLGSYRSVLFGILRVIGTEALAWTTLGMIKGHTAPRRLLICAGMNTAAIARLARKLRARPELLDDAGWIQRESLLAFCRYLVYPAITTRRSYWRRPASDAPFFIQTWTPIALYGAGLGARGALVAGSVYGPLAHLAAAALNGERQDSPVEVRRSVLGYSVGTVVAGVFTANMASTLKAARTDELAEQVARHERQRAVAEKELAEVAFGRWKDSLADLAEAVVRQLEPADAVQLLREIDAELTPDIDTAVTARGTVEEVIDRAERDHAVQVTRDVLGPDQVSLPSLQAIHLVIHTALGNVRRHSGVAAARVAYRAWPDGFTVVVEDAGRGPGEPLDIFDPHHALGHADAYLRGLGGGLSLEPRPGGGTILTATWTGR
ncbi:hypothetical protein GCU56_20425 [Geodermatophilus sabuli]|uniref:Signal transduction histidine kinase n=1 Tax=Geodermatophilus sabuli TaxID=1564158 RepID=A0A7K3W8M9_9ACTN|nr:hypothetical protein [Geodermatophilus sabuli]NEK60227.1 hypothetical protein [Geodermatophilus sabuli]